MQRLPCSGVCVFLGLAVWVGVSEPARGQDRAGAAGMAAAAQAPPPPPGARVPPPPAGGVIPPAGAGVGVDVRVGVGAYAGNLGIGTIPITPPIGYAAAPRPADYNMGRFFYYPFYYFPHSYWPQQSCQWPERPGQPYMRPPAYMTYPAFMEPHWRYEWYTPQKYYRGFHFWLDQF